MTSRTFPTLSTPAGPVPHDAPHWNRQRRSQMPSHRYLAPHDRVDVPLTERSWPSRRLTSAPLWVPVDPVSYTHLLAMYGINDVFDYASDLANPRKGGIEGALLRPRIHRATIWTAIALNVPFLVWLYAVGDPASWTAVTVSLFAVVAYSAPGLRFKERPFLDSATSSVHFVSPAIVGLSLAHAEPSLGIVLVLLAFFLWGMAAHAFGAVQDIGPDREGGIASIATVIGARATVRFSLALWTIAGLVMLATPWPAPLGALLAVPYLVNAWAWRNVSDADAAATNRAWRRFIALNYFSGFLATMIVILAWVS